MMNAGVTHLVVAFGCGRINFKLVSQTALLNHLPKQKLRHRRSANIPQNINEAKQKAKAPDNYVQKEYYQETTKEPIFKILYNFRDYRFENAIAGIWKRSIFALIGAIIVYLSALPFICISKILWFIKPSRKRLFKSHWFTHWHNLIYRNHMIGSAFWIVFLSILTVLKVIWNILYSIYWIFAHIIKWFLMPIAIIIAAIIFALGHIFFGLPFKSPLRKILK